MPVPASENTILLYVANLHRKNCCQSTVNVYLSAVRSLHVLNGLPDPLPAFLRVKLAVRAIGTLSDPPKQKLPLTFSILQRISTTLSASYNHAMLWSALLLGYFGCLRASEFAMSGSKYIASKHLSLSDVKVCTLGITPYIALHIKNSKTDTFSRGVKVYIGCSGHEICAVCSMKKYLQLRTTVFPHGEPDPLFVFQNGTALSKNLLAKQLKLLLLLAGIDPAHYSGHSLRAGAATDAAASGLPDWQISMHGRWASTTYQRYIRTPIEFRTSLARSILQGLNL